MQPAVPDRAGGAPPGPLGYRLVRALGSALLGLFHRRIEVVGIERIPALGPAILAANHPNALVDPMLLLAAVPRRLHPIAKAPVFGHPVIGPFLRIAGAIPVQRRRDPGSREGDLLRERHRKLAHPPGAAALGSPEVSCRARMRPRKRRP